MYSFLHHSDFCKTEKILKVILLFPFCLRLVCLKLDVIINFIHYSLDSVGYTVHWRQSKRAKEILGSFEYNSENGISFQKFEIEGQRDKDFSYVGLAIESNHGKPEHLFVQFQSTWIDFRSRS